MLILIFKVKPLYIDDQSFKSIKFVMESSKLY